MLYVTANILHDLHRRMAASSKFSTLPYNDYAYVVIRTD